MQTLASARVTSKVNPSTSKRKLAHRASEAPPPTKAPGILRHRPPPYSPVPTTETHLESNPATAELLIRFLVSNGIPLEASQDPSFIDMFKHLNSNCALPTVNVMTKILEKRATSKKPLVNYQKTVGPLTVTLDTDIQGDQSFLVFSIHYFEDFYERKNIVYLRKLHLGDITSDTLLNTIRRAINNQIYQLVKFSNIVLPNHALYREISKNPVVKRSFICFYSYMSDFVGEVLEIPELKGGLEDLRKFVKYIKRDMLSYEGFRKMQLKKDAELDVPMLDKEGSWESTALFLTRCLVLHDTFTEYCDWFSLPLYISNTTFTHLVFFQRVLQQCIKHCRNLSQPDNSISQVIPAVIDLKDYVDSIDMNFRFYGSVVHLLSKVCSPIKNRKDYDMATFLDPRYGYGSIKYGYGKIVELEKEVINEFLRTKRNLLSREQMLLPDAEEFIRQELSRYRQVGYVQKADPDDNPFVWWAERQTSFEFLAVIAREHLATPATSISAAAYFGDSGKFHHLCETYSYTQLENYLSSAGIHQKYTGRGWSEKEVITVKMEDMVTAIDRRIRNVQLLGTPYPTLPADKETPRPSPYWKLPAMPVRIVVGKTVSVEEQKPVEKPSDAEVQESSESADEGYPTMPLLDNEMGPRLPPPPHRRRLPDGLQPPVVVPEQQIKLEDVESQDPGPSSNTSVPRIMVPHKAQVLRNVPNVIRKIPFRKAPLPPPISIRAPMPFMKHPPQDQKPQTDQLVEQVKIEDIDGDYEEFERNLEHYQSNKETRKLRREFEEIKPETMEEKEVVNEKTEVQEEKKNPKEAPRRTSYKVLCNVCGNMVPRETLKTAINSEKLFLMLACVFRGNYDIEFAQAFIKRTSKTWVCHVHLQDARDEIFAVLNLSSPDEIQNCSQELLEEVMLMVNALRPNASKKMVLKMLAEFAMRNSAGSKDEEGGGLVDAHQSLPPPLLRGQVNDVAEDNQLSASEVSIQALLQILTEQQQKQREEEPEMSYEVEEFKQEPMEHEEEVSEESEIHQNPGFSNRTIDSTREVHGQLLAGVTDKRFCESHRSNHQTPRYVCRNRHCHVCGQLTPEENLKQVTVDNEKLILMLGYVSRGELDVETARQFLNRESKMYVCRGHFQETINEIYSVLHLETPEDVEFFLTNKQLHDTFVVVKRLRFRTTKRQLRKILYDFASKYHHLREIRVKPYKTLPPPRDHDIKPKNQRQPRKQVLETGDEGPSIPTAQNFPAVCMDFTGDFDDLKDVKEEILDGAYQDLEYYDFNQMFQRGSKRQATDPEESTMVRKARRETEMEHLLGAGSSYLELHHGEWQEANEHNEATPQKTADF